MAARTPRAVETAGRDEILARVLDAADRAPLVPLSDEERALLAEVEGAPIQWIAHEAFAAQIGLDDAAE